MSAIIRVYAVAESDYREITDFMAQLDLHKSSTLALVYIDLNHKRFDRYDLDYLRHKILLILKRRSAVSSSEQFEIWNAILIVRLFSLFLTRSTDDGCFCYSISFLTCAKYVSCTPMECSAHTSREVNFPTFIIELQAFSSVCREWMDL